MFLLPWHFVAAIALPVLCVYNILCVYKTETAILSSQKQKMFFWVKKAPAGALSPSTVLLRGILSVYQTETAILRSQNKRMSLFGRKKPLRERSALAQYF